MHFAWAKRCQVSDNGFARDFEKHFVDVWPHAGAFACGNDNGRDVFRIPCSVIHARALESYSRNTEHATR